MELLAAKTNWNDQTVAERVQPLEIQVPDLKIPPIDLNDYDQLLSLEASYDYA